VKYAAVEEQIREDTQRFDIPQIAYDPYRAGVLVEDLQKHGVTLEMVMYKQIYQYMAQPTELFERAVTGKKIAHGENPVMKWMVACTEVSTNRAGLIMPMKPKRGAYGKRIDGVVASIMAFHRAYLEFGKIQENKVEIWAV
jgi:phage terminase large subunit-like protein